MNGKASTAPLLDAAALVAAGRSLPVPFRIACREGELTLLRLLRVLPGKRVVGEALLNGRTVLAKLFVGRSAERRWRQEEAGIVALLAQGMPTPALLLASALPAGGHVLATEFIAASTSLADDWRALQHREPEGDAALAVLRPAFALLGRMHVRGLVQEDLHLGNFLRAGAEVYVIDGDSVRALSPEVPLEAASALRNLAILFAQLPAEWDARPDELLAIYHAENAASRIDASALLQEVARVRRRRLDDYLAKTTRDCSLFAVDRNFGRFTARVRADADWLAPLLARPDEFLAAGELLKDGSTCTVAQVAVAGRPLVVKRYNLKGVGHALSRAWRPSRGWHSWREGHRLRFLGIATPAPLALVEERVGPLRGRAWLVNEFCAGPRLWELLQPDAEPPADLAAALLRFVAALHRERISHGDFKAANLFWHAGEVYVIDLDAMVQHRSAEAHARAWRRDRARLLRNWPADSVLVRWLAANLPA